MKMMMVLTVVGLLVEAIEKMNVCVKYNDSIDYFMRDYTQSQHLYYKSYIRIWRKKNNINNMTRSYICALNLWRLRVLRDECTFHILHVRVYIVIFFIFVGFHLEFTVFFFWNSYSFGECLFFSAHKFTFTRETLCKNSLILSFIVLMIFFICVVFFSTISP